MMARLLLISFVLTAVSVASADNCLKSSNLLNPVAGSANLFKSSSGQCVDLTSVSYSNIYGADPVKHAEVLNSACVAKPTGCTPPPPPPPPPVSTTFTSKYVLNSTSGNLASIAFSHQEVVDAYRCIKNTNTYKVTLDKTNVYNARFFTAFPFASGAVVRVTLSCPSAPVKSSPSAGNTLYEFPSGCYVSSYMNYYLSTRTCYYSSINQL
jgi:hypothetical protein